MNSAEGLKRLLEESHIAWDLKTAQQLFAYLRLLEKWNDRINLTAAAGWPQLEPLFREGIWASQFYADGATSHLDIGSGAGFPAVILGILVPGIQLELVESRAKKCGFLETVAHALGISGVRVHNQRLESFLEGCQPDKFWDCISWKAVKLGSNDLQRLLAHAHSKTEFWIFHGRDLPAEAPEEIRESFRLLRSERFPARHDWKLSIFAAPKSVSRETSGA